MSPMISVSLQFLACAAVICVAGAKLSRYGDRIADVTGWTGSWVGLVLLATATSMPELATGVSAVRFAGTPEVAIGDILGSCIVNLSLLALVELLHGRVTIYDEGAQGQVLCLAWAILMLALTAAAFASELGAFTIGHVSPLACCLIAVYLLAMRTIYSVSGTDEQPPATAPEPSELRSLTRRFLLAAAAVIAAASRLPFVALELADLTGLGESFVGTLLVALATSLPEIVVTVTAVRIGAHQMAIAGLLGSNLFNLTVLGIDDFFYLEGSLFGSAAPAQLVSLLTALAMSGIVIIAVIRRAAPTWGRLTGASWMLLALFAGNSYYAYIASVPAH